MNHHSSYTGRYPRTMDEAFRDASYANPIERHAAYSWADKLVIWTGVIGFVIVGLMAAVGWIS